jgi:fructose-specific component phosphotransferase system IIB-like protein
MTTPEVDNALGEAAREMTHELIGELYDQYWDLVGKRFENATYYQSRAIEFANNAFRALTYLNGGALVAIPTAVALFQADPKRAKMELLIAAISFVVGLLFVAAAQAVVFSIMSRLAEAELLMINNESIHKTSMRLLGPVTAAIETAALKIEPGPVAADMEALLKTFAVVFGSQANAKITRAYKWRLLGVAMFWASLICFIIGCCFGATALFA